LKPAAYDLPITRGDDYTLPLNVRGRDAQGNKTTISLAGYTVEAKLIYSDGTTSIITANWLSQSTGSLELFVSRTVTTGMPDRGTKWYFSLIDPSNRKYTYMDGNAFIRERGSQAR
jgi:hypothetical protein